MHRLLEQLEMGKFFICLFFLLFFKHMKKKTFSLYLKEKKNTGTARVSSELDMLTWSSFNIYLYCT